MNSPALSNAIVVYTGWHRAPIPARDDARVVEEFGEEEALDLLPRVHALENDFYRSEARRLARDIQRMGDQAADEFRKRHPEVSEDAIQALAWCYTYDYK